MWAASCLISPLPACLLTGAEPRFCHGKALRLPGAWAERPWVSLGPVEGGQHVLPGAGLSRVPGPPALTLAPGPLCLWEVLMDRQVGLLAGSL